jgi:phage I-like protein
LEEEIMPEQDKDFKPSETFDVNDVEIFSVGKWNGEEYTEKDLDDMVEAHSLLMNEVKPYLKLGHNDKQVLLQKDGLPAAGWVVNLKRVGKKLVADFKGIPRKVKELIDKKAYGRFSSEIYWDLKIDEKKYRRVLKAVALLGADTPAVSNLDDFIALYTENKLEYEQLKTYHEEDNNMDDKIYSIMEGKVKEYELKLQGQESEIKQYKDSISNLEGQVKKLTETIENSHKEMKDKEIKSFIEKAVADCKILPAQVEKYTALAGKDFESVKGLVEGMPKLVEIGEKSKQTEKPKKYSEMKDEEKDEKIVEKIEEYMKEHKDASYKEAYNYAFKAVKEV